MNPSRFLRPSGLTRAASSLTPWVLVLLGGCMYSLVQGGLPSHIRTVAVLPFDNSTPDAVLSTQVQQLLQARLPGELGVRLAAADNADALIRGRIVAIEEPPPTAQATPGRTGVEIVEREVRVVAETEIYDVRENRPIFRSSSLTGIGRYRPGAESSDIARTRAIAELARLIVQGAQSQW